MNVYEMYKANKHKLGFWIVRNSWGNTCAQVTSIAGVVPGKAISGRAPYYGNPVVKADFYDLRTGKRTSIGAVVSCPGTSAYKLVEPSLEVLALMEQVNAPASRPRSRQACQLGSYLAPHPKLLLHFAQAVTRCTTAGTAVARANRGV